MEGGRSTKHSSQFQFFLLVLISIFQQNYHNNHLVLTLNEMVGLYCRDWPLKDPPPFLSGLSGSLHGARIFLSLSLEDPSTAKILALGKIQPFACNPYGARMICASRIFLVLGTSSLHACQQPLTRKSCCYFKYYSSGHFFPTYTWNLILYLPGYLTCY